MPNMSVLSQYADALNPVRRYELHKARREMHAGAGELGLPPMREGTTRNGPVEVHWYETGPVDAPLTVVYVHGFNISSQSFYMQVRTLGVLPVRQLLVDVRGHGRTAAASPIDPALLTVDAAADDIMSVLRDRVITGPLIVVGHSLGGPISLSLMRRFAGELDLAGSVQISSAVDPFTDKGLPRALGGAFGRKLYRMVQVLPLLSEAVRRAVTRSLAPILALGFYRDNMPWRVIKFHAAMIQDTPLSTYEGFFADLREHSERGAADVLARIPGYILVGDLDDVAPESQSRALNEVWPRAWLQVLPGSGHMPPLDAPGAVTSAILRLAEITLDERSRKD